MNILFVHQNFPGQFKHLAPALASQGHRVVALHLNPCPPIPGVELVRYPLVGRPSDQTHRWVKDFEVKTVRAESTWRAALQLKAQGFEPDAIVAHPGWGESLFLHQVWPQAALGLYCEFYYKSNDADVGFDPEFKDVDEGTACRLQLKNTVFDLQFPHAKAGLSPTHFQASLMPSSMAGKMTVVHDGIDTQRIAPNPKVRLGLKSAQGQVSLSREDEVITFVNRNLEPYRGYHSFMRALPHILKARPQARVLIIGGDEVSYGAQPPKDAQGRAQSWKQIFLSEVKDQLDLSRVHFLGRVPYEQFLSVIQLSTVHVYLTYPFVLSWSLLEAMSAGCAIVASDTAPVREAITHDKTGLLVDFFDTQALASRVIELCQDRSRATSLGEAARQWAVTHYDLHSHCLGQHIAWVENLAKKPAKKTRSKK
jgi:glycosyltransferase involved in cell wall biosynthesis